MQKILNNKLYYKKKIIKMLKVLQEILIINNILTH